MEDTLPSNFDQPAAVAAVDNPTNEAFFVADTGHNRILFYSFPMDDPTPVWNNMIAHIHGGDLAGAMQYFSTISASDYNEDFLKIGTSNIVSAMSSLGTLLPVYVKESTSQFYFTNVINGQVIGFPVEFDKENGSWRIFEF